MTPVQSQPIGHYPLAAPALPELSRAYPQTRPSIDGVQTGWPERPRPDPIIGGPSPTSPGSPQPGPLSGSTGNSFLDLISQLMSQLDSVISGLGGGTTTGGGGSSTSPPVCGTPLQPEPGTITLQTDPGGTAMQRLLATGEVS